MNSKNTSQKPAGKHISQEDYLKGLRAVSTPFNRELGEALEKAVNPKEVTLKGGKASGRFTKARGFFAYLMASGCVKAELDALLGPVKSPIPAIPVGTFVAHDIFGFGFTAGPVLEGGRAGHKVDIAFEDDIEVDDDGVVTKAPIRRILLSFLEFDDVSADEATDEKNRLIAERVGKEVIVCLPELDEVIEPELTSGVETGDEWVDSDDEEEDEVEATPTHIQAELEQLTLPLS